MSGNRVQKTDMLDSIIDFCDVPRTMGEIAEQFENERTYRAIAGYIKELVGEGMLFIVPGSEGNTRTQYLNYAPSAAQVATGEYSRDDAETKLKTFKIPPTITGEGFTTFPALNIVMKNNPGIMHEWMTAWNLMLLYTRAHQMQEEGIVTKSQVKRAIINYRIMLQCVADVIESVMKEQDWDIDPDAMLEGLGMEEYKRDHVRMARAYKMAAEKLLIPSNNPNLIFELLERQAAKREGE